MRKYSKFLTNSRTVLNVTSKARVTVLRLECHPAHDYMSREVGGGGRLRYCCCCWDADLVLPCTLCLALSSATASATGRPPAAIFSTPDISWSFDSDAMAVEDLDGFRDEEADVMTARMGTPRAPADKGEDTTTGPLVPRDCTAGPLVPQDCASR